MTALRQKAKPFLPLLLALIPVAAAAYIYTLTLTGTATLVSPALQPSAYTLDFGEVPRGTQTQIVVTLENVGTKKIDATWRAEGLPPGVDLEALLDGEPWTGAEKWEKGEAREATFTLRNVSGSDGEISFAVHIEAS